MDYTLLVILLLGCGALLFMEFLGFRTTLSLEARMKGDVKRESRWLAQYGQSVCTPIAGLLVFCLDPSRGVQRSITVVAAVLVASFVCMILKRLLGRIRPGREGAGDFTGFSWKHANYRESFPSSHSACAVALSATLAAYYPQATLVFWSLAIACAALRYIMDAHYPSDVLGGIALGYVIAHLTLRVSDTIAS